MTSPATETTIGLAKNPLRDSTPYDPSRFDWPLAYDAEKLLNEHIGRFLTLNSFAKRLAERMRDETGTDFFEWVDHLVLSPADEQTLRAVGFSSDEEAEAAKGDVVLHHPRATLPRVVLRAGQKQNPSVIALRPEFVTDFAARHNLAGEIEGAPLTRFRRTTVAEENGTTLEAVERRAYRGFVPAPHKAGELEAILKVKEMWKTRRRFFANDAEGFVLANRLLDQSISLVGRDQTCQIYFEEERAYWELRNRAARVQKFRQDQLGLGWGNHDHHTFRASRQHFVDLMEILLKLGFEKRERYYAGAEAGWGAQISEQAIVGITVFADVDLMPDETQIDFASHRLPAAPKLGTVGLWCGLHGESFLSAGMHHLEARFDYHLLRDQLQEHGIKTMNPFSNFEFLRQAFTEGERWKVARDRAEHLLSAKLITQEQFDKFMNEGALGSHLENLQRHGGFKGFNQKSVSVVISATDPRRNHFEHAATH
ncbi:hypothetical protein [Pedosphaera parvula]|uniref:Uncharacterized protein n=1 Tax=Pedosphaera parvula (strain Ellin514) TaxID=320771 RepID=B9XL42_PEDPL|nr:hypothetical protein [Pedosphaera parvula]EEF59393.1 conserved hypothetical protein [Pedosphaera parvula Ellin514]